MENLNVENIEKASPPFNLTRREYFAGLFMQTLISNTSVINLLLLKDRYKAFSKAAVEYADALIATLDKEG